MFSQASFWPAFVLEGAFCIKISILQPLSKQVLSRWMFIVFNRLFPGLPLICGVCLHWDFALCMGLLFIGLLAQLPMITRVKNDRLDELRTGLTGGEVPDPRHRLPGAPPV